MGKYWNRLIGVPELLYRGFSQYGQVLRLAYVPVKQQQPLGQRSTCPGFNPDKAATRFHVRQREARVILCGNE